MYEQQIIIAPSRQGRSCEAAQIAKSMPTWLLLLLGVASRQEQPYHKGNDRPAPWRCDEPRSRARTDLCFPLDDSLRDDGSDDVRLYNMEPEPVKTNRSCCGLPPAVSGEHGYPLTCLLDKVPFATPPACVKRQFKCCLDYWTNRFRLDEAYTRAPPHVRCDSKFWDVYDVQVDDVIFDQRSLMKLAAAFAPWIFVPYEAERVPALTELNGTNSDYVVVAKLGFGWFDPMKRSPTLVLAHNRRNPARPAPRARCRAASGPRLWKDRCADNRRPDHVRCAGIRLHRDRARKILALRKNGVCERAADGNSGILARLRRRVERRALRRFAAGCGLRELPRSARPFHRVDGWALSAFSRRRHRGDRRRRRADSGTTEVAAPAWPRRGTPRRTARSRKERRSGLPCGMIWIACLLIDRPATRANTPALLALLYLEEARA